MGILEEIKAQNAEILTLLKGGAGAATGGKATTAATGDKPETAAEKKKRLAAEAEAAKPTFTAEQLRDKYLAVMEKFGDTVAKELISEAGYDKLAKLVADAPNWQKSWDLAEAKLEEDEVVDDNGGL